MHTKTVGRLTHKLIALRPATARNAVEKPALEAVDVWPRRSLHAINPPHLHGSFFIHTYVGSEREMNARKRRLSDKGGYYSMRVVALDTI